MTWMYVFYWIGLAASIWNALAGTSWCWVSAGILFLLLFTWEA